MKSNFYVIKSKDRKFAIKQEAHFLYQPNPNGINKNWLSACEKVFGQHEVLVAFSGTPICKKCFARFGGKGRAWVA